MAKITPAIRAFIEAQLTAETALSYAKLRQKIAQKYGVQISKSTISKRAKVLKLKFRRGRKRIIPVGKMPARSIFLDCAGAFFLKGAELEMGLLRAMSQLLVTSTTSVQAQKALKLAQQINACLLYAPIFGLKTAEEFAGYQRRGLLYLTEQNSMPHQIEVTQYLRFLSEQKLLLPIIKEVEKTCAEALCVRIDFSDQTFYLDAQGRTIWPKPEIPWNFSTTLNKALGYIKDIFQFPSAQRPLILQTCPGYTFLPTEMFNLIQCFEKADDESISRIVVRGKFGENLAAWQGLTPPGKCFFLAPLSPWQYARLQGTQIVRGFHQYRIGPEKEVMAVADAQINLFNSQLNKNIRVRAAMVRRKEERLALITNISPQQERYIRRIAEQYFSRWPNRKQKTYYDLLEEAHEDMLGRTHSQTSPTPLLQSGYSQRPQDVLLRQGFAGLSTEAQANVDVFRLFSEHLHRYARTHFFPSEYDQEGLTSMCEKFYQHCGYLKIKQHDWEIILRTFPQKKLQEAAKIACYRFNQMGLRFPHQKNLRIYLQ